MGLNHLAPRAARQDCHRSEKSDKRTDDTTFASLHACEEGAAPANGQAGFWVLEETDGADDAVGLGGKGVRLRLEMGHYGCPSGA